MKLELKNKDEIRSLQTEELLGANSPFSQTAVDAEILRNVLWLDSEGSNPIHTKRIVNQAMKFSLPNSLDSNSRERLKKCLEKLIRCGDLISFSEGRWLPAALKEIVIHPDLSESLLVGGTPTNSFPKSIRNKITPHKQYRKIWLGLIDEIYNLPKFSITAWAKIPTENLESWTLKVRNFHLEDFSVSKDQTQHEFYLPQTQNKGRVQKFRWKQQFSDFSGKFLCRWRQVKGTSYHMAELLKGIIVGLSDPLPKHYYHRYMYGEDIIEGKSVPAYTEIVNNKLTVKLFNYLPIGEYMIFDALGELDSESNDFLIWKFDIKYRSVIFETLQRLKIDITEN